jgi:phosphate transport system substrate-binding protein
VAQIVKTTAGAIGYVDLSDAKATGLQYAELRNKGGKFVPATLQAAEAALAGSPLNPDLTYSPLNADGDGAYPITAPTWIIAYKNQADRNKGEALKSFLRFTVTEAQKDAAEVDFAKLPAAIQARALAQIENLVVPAT